MQRGPLFKILSIVHQDDTVKADLKIERGNEIFKGHFPDQPVVPGASMLQAVKDVLEKALNQSLRLKKADNIKFLLLVEPGITHVLQLNLTYKLVDDQINITANLMAGEVVCMKLQGVFTGTAY